MYINSGSSIIICAGEISILGKKVGQFYGKTAILQKEAG
jgi:hypothetical protein